MKRLIIVLSSCLVALPALAQYTGDYEPFSDSTPGGTSYTPGDNLSGQSQVQNPLTTDGVQGWWSYGPDAGYNSNPGPFSTAAVQPTIVSGDLTYAGLASAGGGRSAQFGGNGDSALMDLSFSSGGLTPGSYPTVYFSYTLKLTDLSVLDTNGVALTGFNQLQAHDHNYSVVPAVGGVVMLRGDGAGGFNLGIDGGGKGGTPATIAWDTTSYSAGQTLFLVGNYDFTSGDYATGDGHLWINPNASTFGAGSAPGGDLLSGGNSQALARIGSIILEDNADTEPTGQIDDLRVGLTWADVTPAAVPEPSAFAFGAMGMLCLWLVRFRRKSV